MPSHPISRREAIARTALLLGGAAAAPLTASAQQASPTAASSPSSPFRFCFNTATIRGQKLGIVKEVEIAAQAGYQAIEPWVDSIQDYAKGGGSLPDLKKRIADLGMTVEDAISFAEWAVDDDAKRARGVELAKTYMDLVAQVGGKRLACPPAGATNLPKLDLFKVAERYKVLLEAGDQIGVVPQLELWGFSQNLSRLSECGMVALETAHPKACVLVDIFHLYKGGSEYPSLSRLNGDTVHILHMNDYPADISREKVNDSLRIFPGDGGAPIVETLRTLQAIGGPKILSLELFSRKYWEQDPLVVAKAGLAKMKAVVDHV
jgi:sugar phosphate isomerase/epimerase